MRLIKLSKKIFNSVEKVHHYFTASVSELRNRDSTCGVFLFPKGWIAKDGVSPNEIVLFSYDGNVVYITKTLSERLPWNGPERADYPYCLQIDLANLKMVSFPILDLELALSKDTGMSKSLTAQGWPILPDSKEAETAVNRLVSASKQL